MTIQYDDNVRFRKCDDLNWVLERLTKTKGGKTPGKERWVAESWHPTLGSATRTLALSIADEVESTSLMQYSREFDNICDGVVARVNEALRNQPENDGLGSK